MYCSCILSWHSFKRLQSTFAASRWLCLGCATDFPARHSIPVGLSSVASARSCKSFICASGAELLFSYFMSINLILSSRNYSPMPSLQSTIYPQSTPYNQPIPTEGPATEPEGPRSYQMPFSAQKPSDSTPILPSASQFASNNSSEIYRPAPQSPASPSPSPEASSSQGGAGANHYPSASGVPRLPPILQVEKVTVTTSATQLASASRRRNEANFLCPVPGCGSTFTRRFNLRGTYLLFHITFRRLKVSNRSPSLPYGGASLCL